MMSSTEAIKPGINFYNIPSQLKEIPNWAFYTGKKVPIQISAVARGWPADGWDQGLSKTNTAGAKSNDHNTWGLFDDCKMIYDRCVATGTTLSSTKIIGPTFALQAQHEIVVIDLDDPMRSLKDKRNPQTGLPHTDAEMKLLVKAAYDSQSLVLRMFQGHYIERSASGKGYHIFVFGKLPHERYKFSFHGSVFSSGQFINMTGMIDDLGTWTSYMEPKYDNVIDMDGNRIVKWVERAEPVSGPVVCGKMQQGQALIDDFYNHFAHKEIGILIATDRDRDSKFFEDGETFELDYCKFGRRNDLSDEQVIEKLSKGMQAVYQGGSITGDHSEDTYHLMGDLEKITASVDQVERIMKRSPRMINAGIGNDGQPRWDKHTRMFNRNFARARQANDKIFLKWEASGSKLGEERSVEMQLSFERMTSANDPNSLAYKAARALREAQDREEKIKTIHAEQSVKFPKARRFTGTAEEALHHLSCGIDPVYLTDCMPPGRMNALCYYTHEGMYEPYMKFAIPAAFTAIAGIVARKYKLDRKEGDALILHMVLLAKSAIGKTQSIKAIESFLSDLRQEIIFKDRFEDRDISSQQGFHEILQTTPCLTWLKDECAPQLKSIIAPSSNDQNAERLRAFTNRLFDLGQANKEYHPIASVRSQKSNDQPIKNLCVSAFWGSTQANVKDYFTSDAVHTGIISRIVFINHMYAGGVYHPNRNAIRSLPQGDLREVLKVLLLDAEQLDRSYVIYPDKMSPDAADPENPGSLMARPNDLLVPVVMDQDARDLYTKLEITISQFKQEIHNEVSKFPDYYIALARTALIASRMAGIMAVLDNPRQPIITYQMVAWSLGYILNATCGVLSSFETLDLGGATMASASQKAMVVFKKMCSDDPKKPIPVGRYKNYLIQNSPFREERNPSKAAEDTLYDLVDEGILDLGGNILVMGARSATASITRDEGKKRPGGRGCYVLMTDHDAWNAFM